jgi:hypothetical protein
MTSMMYVWRRVPYVASSIVSPIFNAVMLTLKRFLAAPVAISGDTITKVSKPVAICRSRVVPRTMVMRTGELWTGPLEMGVADGVTRAMLEGTPDLPGAASLPWVTEIIGTNAAVMSRETMAPALASLANFVTCRRVIVVRLFFMVGKAGG